MAPFSSNEEQVQEAPAAEDESQAEAAQDEAQQEDDEVEDLQASVRGMGPCSPRDLVALRRPLNSFAFFVLLICLKDCESVKPHTHNIGKTTGTKRGCHVHCFFC